MHPNILSARHREEALSAIRRHKYEVAPGGIVIPSMKLAIGGVFETAKGDGPWDVAPNLIVTEGLNHILGVALAQATQKLAFYIAPFGGNVSVAGTWTGANFAANATELTTAYSEANRVEWEKGSVAAGSVGNSATPAVFTFAAGGPYTVRGVALLEASGKGATTGVLIAAARLAADKVMSEAEELRVKYTLSATST